MKTEMEQILGKTIIGVIIKENLQDRPPRSQLFLIFDDHSSYEFYSSDGYIQPTGGLDKNTSFREVYNYMSETMQVAGHAVADPDAGLQAGE